MEIKDKKGVENMAEDRLSRLENVEVTRNKQRITKTFPDEQLMKISEKPWFEDMTNYKATNMVPEEYIWK